MKLAIIPARGGSRRIPRKNIREFAGSPVIHWSISATLMCGLFDKVVVSTDDEEIAQVARQNGALVPFMRPTQLADDYTPTRQVVNHAIESCEAKWGRFDTVCCVYATAPLLESSDLTAAYQLLENTALHFVFSAVQFEFPIQRAFKLNKHSEPDMVQPENRFTRSQDLEPMYHDAAQFYWGRRDAFMQGEHMFAKNSKAYVLPANQVRDLDTEEDWQIALALWQAKKNKPRGAA
jgi:N-acylneuraminate cytidylyltransferase